MRRLHPGPATDVSIADAYSSPLGAPTDRAWIGLSMVASIDGSTVVDGVSGGLSSENDAGVLHRLRELADAIIVGAGTIRAEGYGPPKRPGQRIGVVTASGSVDLTSPLFASGAGFLITTEDATIDASPTIDVLRCGVGSVDVRGAIGRLDEICPDPKFVQAEGGAGLNAALLDADVIDEIDVTTSPLAVGGDGPRLSVGASDLAHRFELAQLAVDDESFVYSRWRRVRR